MRFLHIVQVWLVLLCEEGFSMCVNESTLPSVRAVIFTDIDYYYRFKYSPAYPQKENIINFNTLNKFTVFINVTKANISQLCKGIIKNLPELKELNLDELNLTTIEPGAFQNLPKLTELGLSENRLTTILKDVFNVISSLEIIYLIENQIETIEDGAFAEMPNLFEVHLDHNNIAQLDGKLFYGNPFLQIVYFSFNKLRNISKNSLNDLKQSLIHKERKRSLYHFFLTFDHNEIENIDAEALSGLNKSIISLRNNIITNISAIVYSGEKESRFSLENNSVSCVDNDAIEQIAAKELLVTLYDNPLDCECRKRIKQVDFKKRGEGKIAQFPLTCTDMTE